jgi:glucose-1-phosphatase
VGAIRRLWYALFKMVHSSRFRRVVCFDLGGVLVRIVHSWAEACDRCGIPLKNPEWIASETARSRRTLVVDKYQRGELESGAFYIALAAALDGLYTPAEVERIHRAWLLGEYPGFFEILEDLAKVPNVRTACLSNTNAVHWRQLQEAGSFPSFNRLQYRLASHLLGCLKPDPHIYKLAQSHLEADATEIVFFDDLEANVEAARNAGWAAEQIDPRGDTPAQIRAHLTAHGVLVGTV